MLIGFAGKAGSGKDAAAATLVRHHGFTRIALADPMKRITADVYGFTEEQLWGPSEARNAPDPQWDGLTPRKALQLLGTEWARQCHPDTWVRYLVAAYERLRDIDWLRYTAREGVVLNAELDDNVSGDGFVGLVVTDVRFPNEVEAIRRAGGHVVRVLRDTTTLQGQHAQHASETSLDDIPEASFAATIKNAGTLEDLERMVVRVYEHCRYNVGTGRLWISPESSMIAL